MNNLYMKPLLMTFLSENINRCRNVEKAFVAAVVGDKDALMKTFRQNTDMF